MDAQSNAIHWVPIQIVSGSYYYAITYEFTAPDTGSHTYKLAVNLTPTGSSNVAFTRSCMSIEEGA